jgi:hypothetical protein
MRAQYSIARSAKLLNAAAGFKMSDDLLEGRSNLASNSRLEQFPSLTQSTLGLVVPRPTAEKSPSFVIRTALFATAYRAMEPSSAVASPSSNA